LTDSERSSETGTILSHPINLLVTKMSFLLTCIFKPRLESLGVSVDEVNFTSEVNDFEALQALGKAVIDDV
jgi:hypothetical protein